MSAAPIAEIRGLRKDFILRGPWPWSPESTVAAIKGVDLQLMPGQVLALVGQSGSGKTTLARILLGLEQPSGGEILIEGRRWDTMPEAQRHRFRVHYQYVPQDAMSALDPQQTALEHVAETLRVLRGYDRRAARQKAEDMLARLGLSERFGALPRELSGGEQRRVTLARVLALDPRLVVADEPTSGLDPDRRHEVLRDLVGNLPKGAACILVTHNLPEARAWCTHAAVMLDGWVIETFDPRVAMPMHPYSKLLFDPWSGPLPGTGLAREGCPYRRACPLYDAQPREACQRAVPALAPLAQHAGQVACHALSRAPVDRPGGARSESTSPAPDPDLHGVSAPQPHAQG
ncbi:MAG: dipeptide/oligopeptide/nickel ABC transporter ATP-binding protein [Pseudomonadota bacterium]